VSAYALPEPRSAVPRSLVVRIPSGQKPRVAPGDHLPFSAHIEPFTTALEEFKCRVQHGLMAGQTAVRCFSVDSPADIAFRGEQTLPADGPRVAAERRQTENETAVSLAIARDTAVVVPPRGLRSNFLRFFASRQHVPTPVNARHLAKSLQRGPLTEPQMSDPSLHCCAICVPTGSRRPNASQGRVFSFSGALPHFVGGRAVVQMQEANITRSTQPQIQFRL
jgi:hypothetical protein